MNTIKFYIREEPYGFLSNFWRAEQLVIDQFGNEEYYPTNEHFYQSQKAKNSVMREWIANAPNAFAAMKAGRALRPNEVRENWELDKTRVMLIGLRAKFSWRGNKDIRDQLVDTGDAILVEDSPTDMVWGGSLPGSKNMLGNLLMKVRGEINEGRI